MLESPLDRFGRLIVTCLRDHAIDHYDTLANQQNAAPGLQKLQTDLAALSPEQRDVARRCVVSAIDTALHDFLFGLVEAHDFEKGIEVLVDGQNVVELSDGLHGEQFSENGWIAKFGKHPEQVEPSKQDNESNAHAWRDAREDTPSCPKCGKPLRTAKAKQCFQCGASWH